MLTLDHCRYNYEVNGQNKWSYNGLEQHASIIYTSLIFQKVQIEFKNAIAYGVKDIIPKRMFELKKENTLQWLN